MTSAGVWCGDSVSTTTERLLSSLSANLCNDHNDDDDKINRNCNKGIYITPPSATWWRMGAGPEAIVGVRSGPRW